MPNETMMHIGFDRVADPKAVLTIFRDGQGVIELHIPLDELDGIIDRLKYVTAALRGALDDAPVYPASVEKFWQWRGRVA